MHMKIIFLSFIERLISIADAVCGAPKRRFRPYQPAVAKNANATDVRKARKEQLKKEEATG